MTPQERTVIIDCRSAGISGDMFLSALIDLGADPERVIEAIKTIESTGEYGEIEVKIKDVYRRGIQAKSISITTEKVHGIRGGEIIKIVEEGVKKLNLSDDAFRFASGTIRTLIETEARIHGRKIEDVHLHEAGQIDTPADIIGAAAALDDLDLFDAKVYSTPVAVGGGLLKFSHGIMSSPAPATLEILKSRKAPIIGGPVASELTTPTGAAIIVNLTDEYTQFYPPIKPSGIGYGAGKRDLKDMPNILRIITGEPLGYHLPRDEVSVIETNLDDISGEVIGHLINELLVKGARDVNVIPIFTKKNRPGYMLKVIADIEDAEELSRTIIEETGSLGVRIQRCERRILNRESVPIKVRIFDVEDTIKIKVSMDSEGRVLQIKPEYEDVKRLAYRTGKPIRVVMEMVREKAREELKRVKRDYSKIF